MSRIIKTIETDRWGEPDENRRVKHLGMIKAKDAFDKLYAHLDEKGMLPDEYFSFSESSFQSNTELPSYRTALCCADFGGSEGIYMDIYLKCRNGVIHFAAAKTLDASADSFYKMSRLAAECSLMLNGRGSEFVVNNTEAVFAPEEAELLGEAIAGLDTDETETLSQIKAKLFPEDAETPELEAEGFEQSM